MGPVTDSFRTTDGATIATHAWEPEPVRATCLLVHGYAEHALRYGELAHALGARGIAVRAPDLRGHGASPGVRGDVPSFERMAADVATLLQRIRDAGPGLPTVLFGHSLGGAVALRVALDHQSQLSGLVLSSPFLRPSDPPSPALLTLASLLARWLPTLPVQPLDATRISRDPDVVAAYRSDPLVYNGRVRARTGNEMVRAGPALLAGAGQLTLPTLVIHGDADGLADVEASRELAVAAGSDDLTLRIVEGGYHELLNDVGRERTLLEVVDWIAEHAGAAAER